MLSREGRRRGTDISSALPLPGHGAVRLSLAQVRLRQRNPLEIRGSRWTQGHNKNEFSQQSPIHRLLRVQVSPRRGWVPTGCLSFSQPGPATHQAYLVRTLLRWHEHSTSFHRLVQQDSSVTANLPACCGYLHYAAIFSENPPRQCLLHISKAINRASEGLTVIKKWEA